jgi:pimeloyl-ACP methyl ester carboxylesterase
VANTVAVDLPGHGHSHPPARDRVEDYTRALSRFITAVGAPAPVPCGLSIGGAIAQQLLLDQPGVFTAGILVSTGARLRVLPDIIKMISEDFDGFLNTIAALEVSPRTDPARTKGVHEITAACPPAVTLGDFTACDRFDVMARLAEIRVPVLVVSAADDRLTPPKYGNYLQTRIPGARGVQIDAAGHLVPVEQPEAFNAAVADFIQAL